MKRCLEIIFLLLLGFIIGSCSGYHENNETNSSFNQVNIKQVDNNNSSIVLNNSTNKTIKNERVTYISNYQNKEVSPNLNKSVKNNTTIINESKLKADKNSDLFKELVNMSYIDSNGTVIQEFGK